MSNSKINAFVAACFASITSDDTAKADKGAALLAAHKVLDSASPATIAETDKAIAAIRPAGNKDKKIERVYKLGKRFTALASFTSKHGHGFQIIGTALDEKKTISLNMVEQVRSALSDTESRYHAAALTWRDSVNVALIPAFTQWLADCATADKATSQAEIEETNARFASQGAALATALAQIAALEKAAAKKTTNKKAA